MIVDAGSVDITTYFMLRKAADGTELTGATIADIDLTYCRSGAAPSAKVDATALAATDSAHSDNKAIEVDGTNKPGIYRIDWPDAAFATGVREVTLTVKYATAFTESLRVELSPVVSVSSTSIASIAAAVWAVLTSAVTTAGSMGKYIIDSLASIGTSQIIVVNTSSAISTDGGTLFLVRGNSYATTQGWTPPSWAVTGDAPDVTDADVYLRLPGVSDVLMTVTPGEGGYTITGNLTSQQTGAINGDSWELVAVWTSELGVKTGIQRVLQGKISWQ